MGKPMLHRFIFSTILVLITASEFYQCEITGAEEAKYDLLIKKLDDIDRKFQTLERKLSSCSYYDGQNQRGSPERFFAKRDANRETLPSRDLFHFNKLAGNLNSIPASSSIHGEFQNEEAEKQDALPAEKRIVMAIGQHYESLFGNALENLNLMLKEQLASFKLTLNKLMNRLADHNYQHNVLTNHMALIKDECSLASNYADIAANLSHSLMSELSNSSRSIERPAQSALVEQNTMRTSDIMMIVRLLGVELDQMIQKSVVATGEQLKLSQADKSQSSHVHQAGGAEEQEVQLRLGASIEREMKSMQRRFDELDSVVKHSANMLTKLTYNSSPSQPLGLDRYSSNSNDNAGSASSQSKLTILNYSNANETIATSQQANNKSRWFAGSKRPNQPVVPLSNSEQSSAGGRLLPKCQAKTNLVTPTSCRQLRDAGANCTGQYYVFVRGTIKHVYCDMNMDSSDEGGGWTVVLRRIDKAFNASVNELEEPSVFASNNNNNNNQALKWFAAIKASQVDFKQDWTNYKNGFGNLDSWSEFFIGLDLMQQLVSSDSQSHQLQLDIMTNNSHELHLKFDQVSLEHESEQYRIHVAGCNSTEISICQPILSLNSSKFYTYDTLIDQFCPATNETGLRMLKPKISGWWLPAGKLSMVSNATREDCERNIEQMGTTDATDMLTKLIGRQQEGSNGPAPVPINHLHWPNWEHSHEPIRQLVLKVRPRRRLQQSVA